MKKQRTPREGFVYLARSGPYVKIGASNQPNESEFGEALGDLADHIQLPLQRHWIEALIAGKPIQDQIDLPMLERTIYVLTQAACTDIPPASSTPGCASAA